MYKYRDFAASIVHKADAPRPKHASGCIFMHHHWMLWSLTRCAGPQKPSSRLSEGYICRIVDMNFGEFLFHAVRCIGQAES
jgi:hypothetical protein